MNVHITITFPAIGLEKLAKASFQCERRELRNKIHDFLFLKCLDWFIDGSHVPQPLLSKCIHFEEGYAKAEIMDDEGHVLDIWQSKEYR